LGSGMCIRGSCMACLCERMYPNYGMFCKQTGFGDGQIYRRILDLIWGTLTVKDAKVNFDSQLEKFEEAIPAADDYDLYGVYPAIDALSLIHLRRFRRIDRCMSRGLPAPR
ncbi:DUF416 family protein, partial [Klebsiella pneumoniae]|uniref:DUF416 family protein n=1 Tax=Klebsiella pneumoniae TaxID=573 RepID=UPI003F75F152